MHFVGQRVVAHRGILLQGIEQLQVDDIQCEIIQILIHFEILFQ